MRDAYESNTMITILHSKNYFRKIILLQFITKTFKNLELTFIELKIVLPSLIDETFPLQNVNNNLRCECCKAEAFYNMEAGFILFLLALFQFLKEHIIEPSFHI